jgi:hypothetical protein
MEGAITFAFIIAGIAAIVVGLDWMASRKDRNHPAA